MTISRTPRSADGCRAHDDMRCDLCGRRVRNAAAHLDVCLEHELAMFAVGRRAG